MTSTYTRSFTLRSVETATGVDDTIRIAISTETPFLRERFGGHAVAYEVLSHRQEDIDFSYLADEGAPFCFEHDVLNQLGVLRNVSLDADGVLRADVLFSLSAKAQEIKSDMERGIRKRISVGYEILDMQQDGTTEEGIPVIRCVWRPYEASTVSIPADMNAGVGRSITPEEEITQMKYDELKAWMDEEKAKLREMLEEIAKAQKADGAVVEEVKEEESITELVSDLAEAIAAIENTDSALITEDKADDATLEQESTMKEQKNGAPSADYINEVTALATRYNKTDKLASWITSGRSVAEIKAEVLDSVDNTRSIGAPAIITSKRDNSFAGAVRSFLRNDNSELAERGIDQARKAGFTVEPGKLYIPTDVPMVPASALRSMFGRSAYGNGAGAGANGVGREFLSWEETLREGALLARIGGEIRTLNDVASVPFFSAPTTGSVFAETGSVSVQTVQVGIRQWTPKRVAARYSFTNLLGALNGTYDIEAELYRDLLGEGARIFDQQIFAGAGGVQVTGLVNNTAIAAYAPSGAFDLTNANALIATVAQQNAPTEGMTFVLDTGAYGVADSTGVFGVGSGKSVVQHLQDSGYQVVRTNFLPRLSTPARAQAIAGQFNKVTAATFGPVTIERDTLTAAATGETILNMQMFMDAAARQPGHLVRWQNILNF